MKTIKKKIKEEFGDRFLMIEPMSGTSGEKDGEGDNQVLQLQLTMATSSINHEYARLEFDDTVDQDQREALLDYMNECRQKYFEARQSLMTYDPNAATEFERDLLMQKKKSMGQFNA